MIQRSDLHERSPCAPKFEDGSEEETLKQERCVRRVAWTMAKSLHKLKEKDQVIFHLLFRSYHSQRGSANERRRNSVRLRF